MSHNQTDSDLLMHHTPPLHKPSKTTSTEQGTEDKNTAVALVGPFYLSYGAGSHLCPHSSPVKEAVCRKEALLGCYSAEESTAPGRCAGLPCVNTHTHIRKMLLDEEPDQRNNLASSQI